jgi:hypothetical protein
MGAVILVTLGVLFLIDNYAGIRFSETFPVLLLVIGGVLLVSRTGSTEGHVQPGWIQGPTAPPPAQQPWTSGAVPPPPSQPQQWASGTDNPPSSPDQNDSQVKP